MGGWGGSGEITAVTSLIVKKQSLLCGRMSNEQEHDSTDSFAIVRIYVFACVYTHTHTWFPIVCCFQRLYLGPRGFQMILETVIQDLLQLTGVQNGLHSADL